MNGVLVLLEYRGAWNRMSWEALAAGQEIAAQLNQPLLAAVAGSNLEEAPADLAAKPLARAYTVRHALLGEYTAGGFVAAFAQLIHTLEPRSEEHTSELQSLRHLVCRLLLEN